MNDFKGITTKLDKDNNIQIMVRFMYEGKKYPPKNFTKLYGCKNKSQAKKKLAEIKVSISRGENPFIQSENNLNEIFKKRIESKKISGDWAKTTIDSYELFYNKVLKKPLGHKKLNKIKYEDLINITESKEFLSKQSVWKNRLKQILNPIFKDALKKGTVFINPCSNIESYTTEETEEINSKIIDDDILFLSQELYNTVKKYPCKTKSQEPEYQCFLYLVILTARRINEACSITKEDCYIKHKKIISPKEITKSKKECDFPIPNECIDYINSVKSGKLFPNIKRESVYLMFQRLIRLSKIDLLRGKKLTVHNTRDLLLNVLIENGVDSRVADRLLDHKEKGTIKSYISISFTQRKEAFEKYWNLVRNDELSLKKEMFREYYYKNVKLEFEKAWEEELVKINKEVNNEFI